MDHCSKFVVVLSSVLSMSSPYAQEIESYEDNSHTWPVVTEKQDTVRINGRVFPADQIPEVLIEKAAVSNETGIQVLKGVGGADFFQTNGGVQGAVEAFGIDGVVGATNSQYGNGVIGISDGVSNGAGVVGSAFKGDGYNNAGIGVVGDTEDFNGYGVAAYNYSPEDNDGDPTKPGGIALYVEGAIDAYGDPDIEEHVAVIKNSATTDVHVLALYASKIASNTLNFTDNFITFYARNAANDADEAVGSIEGTASGISLNTSAADFAEWLPMRDINEAISAGDIVGVRAGRISKDLTQAEQVQVISTAPAVSGNSPGENRSQHRRVAFIGQVPVKVRGTVKSGDYILPSGDHDGVGIAKSAEQLGAADLNQIVGRAWSASDELGVKQVNVAVGLETHATTMQLHLQTKRIAQLEQQLLEKSSQLERLAARFEQIDQRLAALAASRFVVLKQ
ncbi:MAG: hypothetical protein MI754_10380 [Chromatiales bacterium]|nr:hypothetical protein [Chromatiales bacterium]